LAPEWRISASLVRPSTSSSSATSSSSGGVLPPSAAAARGTRRGYRGTNRGAATIFHTLDGNAYARPGCARDRLVNRPQFCWIAAGGQAEGETRGSILCSDQVPPRQGLFSLQ